MTAMEKQSAELDWLHREKMLLGNEAVARLEAARVLLFGVGGVGGFALEALVRAGIGAVCLVDHDTVSPTNLNRQILADTTTIGKRKIDVAEERCLRINPRMSVRTCFLFADESNVGEIMDDFCPDYVIDAIDTVTSKVAIICAAKERNIPILTSMGTGAKLDPTRFRIADLSKTHTCPLAKAVRLKLRERGIVHVETLFSDEISVQSMAPSEPMENSARHVPGSVSFVPSVAGLIIGGHVIQRLAAGG